MKNVVLIGMMGSGKTTVGKLLAQRLQKQLVDTDALIEAREGCTVQELFETQGEPYFRSVELGVAQALSLRSDLIIACGGGLPMQEGAMRPLKESGVVLWLDRDPGETYDALDVSGRPLAQRGRGKDGVGHLYRRVQHPFYRTCHSACRAALRCRHLPAQQYKQHHHCRFKGCDG